MKIYSQPRAHVFLLLIAAAIRLLCLEADLSYFKHPEDFSDEFWWASSALFLHQHGHLPVGAEAGPFIAGPLYSALLWLWFEIFSPSLFSLRLLAWIAGTLSVLLLYRLFMPLGRHHAFALALTFNLTHGLFVYSRFAQVECLQLLLFLWMIVLLSKQTVPNLIGAGTIAGLATMLKLSFLPMTTAVILYFFRTGLKRNAFKQAALFLLPVSLFYLIYTIAFMVYDFLQASIYFNAFANTYYSLFDLLNPLTIPYRLMYLHQHYWFYDWSALLLFVVGAIRLFIPQHKIHPASLNRLHPIVLLSSIYILLLLLTDFNERRMFMLLPGMATVFIFGIPLRYQRLLKYIVLYVSSLIVVLQMVEFLPFPEIRQAMFKAPFHYRISLLHTALFFLAIHYRNFIPFLKRWKNEIGLTVVALMAIIMLQFNFSRVLSWHPPWLWVLISLMIVAFTFYSYLKQNAHIIRLSWLGIALGMQVYVLANADFSVRESIEQFNSITANARSVAGDQVVYVACFHQPGKILAFTNSMNDNSDLLLDQIKKHRPEIFIRLIHVNHGPISGTETMEMISEKTGCTFYIVERIALLKDLQQRNIYFAEVFQVQFP